MLFSHFLPGFTLPKRRTCELQFGEHRLVEPKDASRLPQGFWRDIAGEGQKEAIFVLDRQSERPGIPAELVKCRDPVRLSQARDLTDAVGKAVL